MMNYEETLEYIYNRMPLFQMVGKSGYKEGLDSMIALSERLGSPHRSFKSIHVGGTNGKGSCSHTLASLLQQHGFKVGLFTSPHLKDFRERIRVNGEMVPQSFVINFIEKHKSFFEECYPSFFEVSFGMAMDYFRQEKVDYAVIEVGLGGRLDSTNIISPILSVITNISLDHQNILGNTEQDIAREKAGIIKQATPVVIGESQGEIRQIFLEKAEAMNAPIFFADETSVQKLGEEIVDDVPYQLFKIGEKKVQTPLMGDYQVKNMTTCRIAFDLIRIIERLDMTEEEIQNGFKNVIQNTHLLGRWQILSRKPYTVCDTGHNVGGITYVAKQLRNTPHEKLHIVFGMVGDKDVSHVLELLPKEATYYFTRASIKRAMEQDKLQALAAEKGLIGESYPTVKEALSAAQKSAGENDLIYIGGSTYVVAEIL